MLYADIYAVGHKAIQCGRIEPIFFKKHIAYIFRFENKAMKITSTRKAPIRALLIVGRCVMPISCLDFSSTIKMMEISSSETSVNFHRNTWRYTSEDTTRHSQRCDNHKPNIPDINKTMHK
jgi:hypothetical protein